MKRFIILFLILTLNAILAKGQSINIDPVVHKNIDFRIPIIKVIGRHMDIERLLKSPKNHAYVHSICLSFNAKGKIDSIYFSGGTPDNLTEIIKPGPELFDSIKAIDFKNEFINKIVLMPILYKRWEDEKIENVPEFLNEFSKLWPKLALEDQAKQVIFLEPFINRYSTIRKK